MKIGRRIFPRRRSARQWKIVLLAVVVGVMAALQVFRPEALDLEPEPLGERCRVERVVDGDTLVVAGWGKVRLIGADTPETVKPHHPVEPWGPEATRFTKQFVAGGEIRLQFDGPRKDKHDRYLAHVWVGDRELGEELIRAGLARAKTHYDYSRRMKARFRAAEAEAKAARRGIHSGPGGAGGSL